MTTIDNAMILNLHSTCNSNSILKGLQNPRKLVLVRDWKDTLTTVKSLRRLRGGAKKGKMAPESVLIWTIAKSMKWALDIWWFGVFGFSRVVSSIALQ